MLMRPTVSGTGVGSGRPAETRAEQRVSQPRLLGGDIGAEKQHSRHIMSVRWKLRDGGTFTRSPQLLCWVPRAPGLVGTRLTSTSYPPPAEVRSESWPHRGAATAASERREPGRGEERPQRCSGAEPSQAVSPVRGADRCDVTAQSAARTPSSFREAPFRINVADVTEPRQETF